MITKLLTPRHQPHPRSQLFLHGLPDDGHTADRRLFRKLGASAVLMGLVGGMMNVVSLCCDLSSAISLTRSANIAFRPLARY